MNNQTPSHNACYACSLLAAPLSFNSRCHFLGFTGKAHSDVTTVKYSFYEHKGLYWYSISLLDGHVMNSLFFVDFSNCILAFRQFCAAMRWDLDESSALSDFVARLNKSNS